MAIYIRGEIFDNLMENSLSNHLSSHSNVNICILKTVFFSFKCKFTAVFPRCVASPTLFYAPLQKWFGLSCV